MTDGLIRKLLEDRLLDPERAREIDEDVRGLLATTTQGLSPVEVATALVDWLGHLSISPGKALTLGESLARKGLALGAFGIDALRGKIDETALSSDRRMQSEGWRRMPFALFAKGHELLGEWTDELTSGVDGVSQEHEKLVNFLAGQVAQLTSPANLPLTNPDVIAASAKERGANLIRGLENLADDVKRKNAGRALAGTEKFRVGEHIAITPGKVIYQNDLIELIQYRAVTDKVGAQPVLIVPAWIMKYYILDLSPHNSLIKYLVDNGKTVFAISWKNPLPEDGDKGMNDYLNLGVMAALDAVGAVCGKKKVHAVGYCLGGTLLTIAAAKMARDGDDRLRSLTSLASQIDFRDGGDIRLYLGDSMLSFVEALMRKQGVLSMQSMVNAWTSLRVSDLVYEPAVERYLLGKERNLNDLLAWNADGTRMPSRMHSEYLRNCYMENNLAENRYTVAGQTICVDDIDVPGFVLGTVTDHVAPWKSVYKALQLMHNEITFVLTTGGHNAGIVSGPSHPRRRYQMVVRERGDRYVDPEHFVAQTAAVAGSWWPVWNEWLDQRMEGERKPPRMGNATKGYEALRDAPGEYVHG